MGDIDVLVPPERYGEAGKILEQLGWHPRGNPAAHVHGCGWTRADGMLDLHRASLPECLWENADGGFWQRSEPFFLGANETRKLCDTDQFLHILAHGQKLHGRPAIWRLDALYLLPNLDWSLLASEAQARGLTLALREGIDTLRQEFGTAFPPEFLNDLERIPIPWGDRLYWRCRQHRNAVTFALRCWLDWMRIRARSARPPGLAEFLRARWGLEPQSSVLLEIARQIGANFRNGFQGARKKGA